jgi:hypothetical protein
MASVLGFISVLMTYFGVNYYLTGLHSYGNGAAVGIHWAIPLLLVSLTALFIVAYLKQMEFEKE